MSLLFLQNPPRSHGPCGGKPTWPAVGSWGGRDQGRSMAITSRCVAPPVQAAGSPVGAGVSLPSFSFTLSQMFRNSLHVLGTHRGKTGPLWQITLPDVHAFEECQSPMVSKYKAVTSVNKYKFLVAVAAEDEAVMSTAKAASLSFFILWL